MFPVEACDYQSLTMFENACRLTLLQQGGVVPEGGLVVSSQPN